MDENHKNVVTNLQAEIARLETEKKRAEDDRTAIMEEFAKVSNTDEAMETARGFIEETLPDAIITIKSLIATSDSDSVRAGLSKFVITTVLDRKLEDKDDTELKRLLTSLSEGKVPTAITNDGSNSE